MSRHPVAARVLALISERGETLADLARDLGVPHATVLKWSGGSVPGGDLLAKLPKALGVSGHWLLTGEGPADAPGAREDLSRARRVAAAEERGRILSAMREAIERIEGPDGLAAVQDVTADLQKRPSRADRKVGGR
jgi:transcriptional regulator with XRE-family HTH domain